MPAPSLLRDPRGWSAAAAAAGPSLLAYNVSPSPTFLNQAIALAGWGLFIGLCAPRAGGRGHGVLWLALALVGAGVCWSWGPGALPASFALSALGLLGAAAVAAAAGAAARRDDEAATLFACFAWGWVAAGVVGVAIGVVQVFAPELPDGDWIAVTSFTGRAVGNLRQPNHLSSVLLWACIATVALVEMRRLPRHAASLLHAAFVFGVVLTASRTGLVSMLLLALWGALDRRLQRGARWMLLAAPLLYGLAWVAMAQWAALTQHTFGGAQRMAETDISSSRFGIWANTIDLIRREPWTGVGFGEFNLAWTLTPFPGRPTALFDHTHNLPLQLVVELGVPLGSAVNVLLLLALGRALRRAWGPIVASDDGVGARAAVLVVVMIGLHSLAEYPLWYAYFLLPAAWAWGYALGTPGTRAAAGSAAQAPGSDDAPPSRPLAVGAVALCVGAALAVWDYRSVAVIFAAPEGAAPLEKRIARGRASLLFGHHADYAAVTSGVAAADPDASFARTAHYLLDARLMIAWSEWLAVSGRTDLARHLAARLREFRKPEAAKFFAPCPGGPRDDPAAPFPCRSPARTPGWREFVGP